jgi:hypothetical protein
MDRSRTLLTYHDLAVEVEETPGDELIEHMHSTVLGQPGGFRYQHTNLVERLTAPGENYFMYLRKAGKMMGSVGFVGRPVSMNDFNFDSWLIRYFSIKAPMRSVPKKRKDKSDLKAEQKRSSVLGRFIQPVFADPSQLREKGPDPDQPAIIYATIEQNNLRSMNFSTQMGLETIGEMVGFTFSRIFPKRSGRMERLPVEEYAPMLSRISEYYRDYTLFVPDPLFKHGNYFVIRESGKIVAGIQYYPVTWRILDFGSNTGNRIVDLLSRLRWFRKRFNTDQMRLIAFDGIYCVDGFEESLFELMEGVLNEAGVYLAIIMADAGSVIYQLFETNRKFGILHRVFGMQKADIRARFINMPEEIRQQFISRPTYIPTYDNS